jgi:acyl-CoA hydrolase
MFRYQVSGMLPSVRMEGRPVRDSVSDYSEIALPIYANPLGNLLGGRILHLMDLAAATAGMRHARRPIVTASVDYVTFLHPIRIGQLVTLKSSVNRVFRTSMEIGVKVWVEDLRTGETFHTNSSYLTFVGLSDDGKPTPIPPLIAETDTDRRRFAQAGLRRGYRLEMREKALKAEGL